MTALCCRKKYSDLQSPHTDRCRCALLAPPSQCRAQENSGPQQSRGRSKSGPLLSPGSIAAQHIDTLPVNCAHRENVFDAYLLPAAHLHHAGGLNLGHPSCNPTNSLCAHGVYSLRDICLPWASATHRCASIAMSNFFNSCTRPASVSARADSARKNAKNPKNMGISPVKAGVPTSREK